MAPKKPTVTAEEPTTMTEESTATTKVPAMPTKEDFDRLVKEFQAREEQLRREKEEAEARADQERREKDQERVRVDQERYEKEQEKARADQERHEKEQERVRADQERYEKEQEKARADASERVVAPTQFLDYIRAVEEHLYATFSIEPNRTKKSTHGTATYVGGKFYPQRFRPWTDFAAIHNQQFHTLATTFADEGVFSSLHYIQRLGRDLSPGLADEMDLRPFIRASIEKPASTIVSRYLEIVRHQTIKSGHFRNNAYGLTLEEKEQTSEPPAPKRQSPVKTIGIPDRWLFAQYHDERIVHILVGEYKAAHNLPAMTIRRVLSAPPGEDFFVRASKQDGQSTSDGMPSNMTGGVFVAKVLCQAYHYMIKSGLEFGYVTSGDGLIFLRVLEDDPNTLYYFWSVFPVAHNTDQSADQTTDENAGQNTPAAIREPHETAAAYLATLCMCAIKSTPRTMSWIDARDEDLRRWPKKNETVTPLSETHLPIRSHDNDGGGAGGASAESTGSAEPRSASDQSALKRPHSSRGSGSSPAGGGSTAGAHKVRSMGPFVAEPPTLPYCTQACLRGLCGGLPLDPKCPNASLHRSAAHAMASGLWTHPNRHALTVGEVQSRVVAQLADNMDKDCQCLDQYGLFGRYGVLFKITVTGFGYTFVAKAVQAVHRRVLQHEAAMYNVLQHFQGWLVPVFLGLIDLVRPLPLRSCARVPHMILLSYVGPDLCSEKALPSHVDFYGEGMRTIRELSAVGVWNDDDRPANLAWSDEVGRVMMLDFGEAYTKPVEPPAAAEPAPAPCRSPLLAKRDLNTYHDGSQQDEMDQVKKQARRVT